jgi:hypothetical protein
MSDLGAYLTAINKTKKNIMRDPNVDPSVISGYPAFIVRRLLSYHPDAVLSANEMNQFLHLDGQLEFEFFLYQLPKKSRFAKLHTIPMIDDLKLIKKHYNYNDERALEVLMLHSKEDLELLRKHYQPGGVVKNSKKDLD